MTNDKFQDLMSLTHVPRWTIIPMTKQQSVAEHTFRVMVISLDLAEHHNMLGNKVNIAELLKWAIAHDGTESKTGDLPTPFKHINYDQVLTQTFRACPWFERSIRYAGDIARAIVGIADTVEALMFIKVYGVGSNAETGIIEDMTQRIIRETNEFGDRAISKRVIYQLSMVGVDVQDGIQVDEVS